MLIKFLSWCCGINIPLILADNIKLRDENDRFVSRIIELELSITKKRELTSFSCCDCKKRIFTDETYITFNGKTGSQTMTSEELHPEFKEENPAHIHCGCYYRNLYEKRTF